MPLPEHVFVYPVRPQIADKFPQRHVGNISDNNLKAFPHRRKTKVETTKDALDVAMKQYDGMSTVYDRFSSDENFEKLKRLYEFREERRAEYEEAVRDENQMVSDIQMAA